MTDPAAAGRALAASTDLGCELAVDDFGTGYSSPAASSTCPPPPGSSTAPSPPT